MTPRTILEIASRFCYDGERAIAFDQRLEIDREALVEFAKAVIEADRESSDEPVAWAYITKDCKIVHYEFVEGLVPLYTRPAPAQKPLSDKEIESVISAHRFAYGVDITAFSFARAVEKKVWEKMHGIGETE